MSIQYTQCDCQWAHRDNCPVAIARVEAMTTPPPPSEYHGVQCFVEIAGKRVGYLRTDGTGVVFTCVGSVDEGAPSSANRIARSRQLDGLLAVEHAYYGTHSGMF